MAFEGSLEAQPPGGSDLLWWRGRAYGRPCAGCQDAPPAREALPVCSETCLERHTFAGACRYAFVGGSADNIKKYRLPVGEFLHNMLQNQKAIISCMAVNEDGVLVSGADNGSLWCVCALE